MGVKYYAGGWKTISTTDSSGLVAIDLLPLNYKFRMGMAAQQQVQDVGSEAADYLHTSKFEYVSTETVSLIRQRWKTVDGPIYLLPGTYQFKIGSETKYLDISGCSLIGGRSPSGQ
ncbi:MAG: hypothetical protein R3D55_10300 [Chloroflexota bacterium]